MRAFARRHPWAALLILVVPWASLAASTGGQTDAGSWWASAPAMALAAIVAGAGCFALAAVVAAVAWRRDLGELATVGIFLAVVSAGAVSEGLRMWQSAPGGTVPATGLLWFALALVAALPQLAPGSSAGRWVARHHRCWTLLIAAAGVMLVLGTATVAGAAAHPGVRAVLAAAAAAGAVAVVRRQVALFLVGQRMASLVAAAALAYIGAGSLLIAFVRPGSSGWWLVLASDMTAFGVASVAAVRGARLDRSVADVLAPVVNRDPLAALEIGLSPEIHAFVAALARKDVSTRDHVVRVGELAMRMGSTAGLRGGALRRVGLGALLHDIGKLVIPSDILTKPAGLTADEFAVIKTHSARGAALLAGTPSLDGVAPLVRWHHERFDGRGYPDGIAGDQIPLEACIVSVADAWDAMTNNRHYRDGMGDERARAILREGRGTQWHPRAVDLLLAVVDGGGAHGGAAGNGVFDRVGHGADPSEPWACVCEDALPAAHDERLAAAPV